MSPQNEPGISDVTPKLSDNFPLGSAQAGLEKIRTRLLDLTGRNKLLNFRHPKSSCLRFVDTSLDQVFQHLMDGNTLHIEPVPESEDASESFPEDLDLLRSDDNPIEPSEQAAKLGWSLDFDLPLAAEDAPRLRVLSYADESDAKCRKLATMARTSIEESGANLLYLCFSFLEWREADSHQSSNAPLLILPVMLEREKTARGTKWVYGLQYSGEDLPNNLSLIEKLRRDFSLEIPTLRDEDTPSTYSRAVAEAVSSKPDWQVRNHLTLTLLSFGKLLMFLDLDPTRWPSQQRITNHEVIKALFEGARAPESLFPDEYEIDDHAFEGSVPPLFYDADSSQHSALIDAIRGRNLVIEGPPGTGKSQTITNLIACALLEGKSVLFVAEKLAALEVVYRRLDAIGLGLFCLELHSHKTQKREMLNGLERRLTAQGSFGGAPNLEHKVAQAKQTKMLLNNYVRLLNTPHAQFGSTIFEIIWAKHRAAMALPEKVARLDSLVIRDNERLSRASYEAGKHATDLFSVVSAELLQHWPTLKDHPWRWLQNTELGYTEQSELIDLVNSTIILVNSCMLSVGQLRHLGLSVTGSLQDLPNCRVLEANVPVPAADTPLYLLESLASSTSRRLVGGFCDHLLAWGTFKAQIASLAELPLAIAAYPSVFHELQSLMTDTESKNLSLLELEIHADRINEIRTVIPPVVSLLSWANEALPSPTSPTRQGMRLLRGFLESLKETRESAIPFRHVELLNEAASNTVKAAKNSADDLLSRRHKLAGTFELSSLPASLELHNYAASLLDSSFLTRWFRRNCRAARSAFRRLLMSQQSHSHAAMIDGFRELAEYKSRFDVFEAQSQFRAVAGPHYAGIDTPWANLLEASEWLSMAARRLCSEDSQLLMLLATMPSEQVKALQRRVAGHQPAIDATGRLGELTDAAVKNLPQPLQIPWNSSIEQLDATAQEVAERVARLTRLGDQSGLKKTLKLDCVTTLADLCRKQAEAASEADRLAAALGLTEIYKGTDTGVRALQNAISFATDIDEGTLPPPVRKWLLQDFERHAPLLHSEMSVYLERLSELEQAMLSIVKMSKVDIAASWDSTDIYDFPFSIAGAVLGEASDFADDLPMFVDWLRTWQECSATTLPDLPLLAVEGLLTPDSLCNQLQALGAIRVQDHRGQRAWPGLSDVTSI